VAPAGLPRAPGVGAGGYVRLRKAWRELCGEIDSTADSHVLSSRPRRAMFFVQPGGQVWCEGVVDAPWTTVAGCDKLALMQAGSHDREQQRVGGWAIVDGMVKVAHGMSLER